MLPGELPKTGAAHDIPMQAPCDGHLPRRVVVSGLRRRKEAAGRVDLAFALLHTHVEREGDEVLIVEFLIQRAIDHRPASKRLDFVVAAKVRRPGWATDTKYYHLVLFEHMVA